jgi:hypothetical protein
MGSGITYRPKVQPSLPCLTDGREFFKRKQSEIKRVDSVDKWATGPRTGIQSALLWILPWTLLLPDVENRLKPYPGFFYPN